MDPLVSLRQAKLDLKRADVEWKHQQAAAKSAADEKMRNRAMDIEYLKITTVLVLVLIVIWYLTNRFGFGRGIGGPNSAAAQSAGKEGFSPYAQTLVADISRTDSSFDYATRMPYSDPDYSARFPIEFNDNAQRVVSEDRLFNQISDLVL